MDEALTAPPLDEDIKFAIRLQANDYSIFDEDMINKLIDEFSSGQYENITELINEKFNTNILNVDPTNNDNNDFIDCSLRSVSHSENVFDLEMYRNNETIELINNQRQSQLQRAAQLQRLQQVVGQQVVGQPIPVLHQMSNSIQASIQPGSIFGSMQAGSMQPDSMELGSMFASMQPGSMQPGSMFGSMQGGSIFGSIQPGSMFGSMQPFSNLIGSLFNSMPLISQATIPINNHFLPVRVTMTKESLNKIQELSYDEVTEKLPSLDPNEKCAICWSKLSEEIEELEKYKILPCNHVFHSECINIELSNYSYVCPTCKNECGEHEAKFDEVNDNGNNQYGDNDDNLDDDDLDDDVLDDYLDDDNRMRDVD